MSRPIPPPAATAPSAPRSGFVTLLGAMSLGLAALGLFSGLVQGLALWLAPGDLVTGLLAGLETHLADLPDLPASLAWSLQHVTALNLAGTLLSGGLLAVSWGLLLRREWARQGFIAFLLLGILLNLAGVLLLWQVQQWVLAANAGLGDPGLDARMHGLGIATLVLTGICTLAITALHLWLVRRLRAPAVRAEFTATS